MSKALRDFLPQDACHCVVIASRYHTAIVILCRPHLLILGPNLMFLRPHLMFIASGHLQWRQRTGVFNIRFVVPQLFR